MKREREISFDVIRTLATLGIIIFHYSYNYIEYNIGGEHPFFGKFINGDWGSCFVAIFFMLSGASLYLSHPAYENPLKFYFKRYISLFPIFYLAYIPAYIGNSIKLNMLYWGGDRKNIIYTLIGMDGYLLNPGYVQNYYRVGEWFMGAIVMIYLLYPFLRAVFSNKYLRLAFGLILFVLYYMNLTNDWFNIADGKNMLTCTFNFYLGMYICKYKEQLKNKISLGLALVVFIVLAFINIDIPDLFAATLIAFAWFVIFINISRYLCANDKVRNCFLFFSKYSFGMFLLHHLIIYKYMEPFSGKSINTMMWFFNMIVIIVLVILSGVMLSICSGFIVKSITNMILLIKSKILVDEQK